MSEVQEIVLLLVGGILAGIVNTISGSGTLFSLGAMVLLNIPITLANTTTRPGVFLQNLSALFALKKYKVFSIDQSIVLPIVFSLTGALMGAVFAVYISEFQLEIIASIAMLACGIFMLPRFKSAFGSLSSMKNTFLNNTLFALAGFYGGFIQIGIGIVMLTLLIRTLGLQYAEANGIKLLIILIYTLPTSIYFTITDQILWKPAILLAIGQIIGAYGAAYFLTKNHLAVTIANLVTFLMIVLTLLKLWFF